MPNWIKNKIIVGKKEYIDILVNKYCIYDEKFDKYDLDFNKVIKMPNDLNIEFSSVSEKGLCLYLTMINPKVNYFGKTEDKYSTDEYDTLIHKLNNHFIVNDKNIIYTSNQVEEILNEDPNYKNKLLKLGKQQIENLLKYNALNWYEWSINNWGCKWNATNFEIIDKCKGILFETPWDPPIPIILEISRQNPDIKIAFLYSDEEIGYNVGYVLCSKGKIDFKGNFKDGTKDAYLLAFDLWGCKDDYIYDKDKNTYVFNKYC